AGQSPAGAAPDQGVSAGPSGVRAGPGVLAERAAQNCAAAVCCGGDRAGLDSQHVLPYPYAAGSVADKGCVRIDYWGGNWPGAVLANRTNAAASFSSRGGIGLGRHTERIRRHAFDRVVLERKE